MYRLILLLISVLACSVNAEEQNIYALRSAYLYYFSHFIEWPKTTAFPGEKLYLCALTDNPNDRQQLETIDNKTLGVLHLAIDFVEAAREEGALTHCHMLYVAENSASKLLFNNISEHTLLVTEGAAGEKGLIHLRMLGKKLRFEIDNKKLQDKGFRVSSKLLRLAL